MAAAKTTGKVYYKYFNGDELINPYAGGSLPVTALPKQQADGSWKPGPWRPRINGTLRKCSKGYHVWFAKATRNNVGSLDSSYRRLFAVEVRHDAVTPRDREKLCVRTYRLLRPVLAESEEWGWLTGGTPGGTFKIKPIDVLALQKENAALKTQLAEVTSRRKNVEAKLKDALAYLARIGA